MKKTTPFLSAVVLAALSPALAPGPALAQPGIWASGNGLIAFQSDRAGERDLFAVDPAGSNLTNLAANPTPPANIDGLLTGDWQLRARSGSVIDSNGNGVPDTCGPCTGDIAPLGHADGEVDIDDLLIVVGAWGACPALPAPCFGNVVNTGSSANTVNIDDLLEIIAGWGPCFE